MLYTGIQVPCALVPEPTLDALDREFFGKLLRRFLQRRRTLQGLIIGRNNGLLVFTHDISRLIAH